MIKDAPLVESISGAEKIPVSDGSNEPRTVSINQIASFVETSDIREVEYVTSLPNIGKESTLYVLIKGNNTPSVSIELWSYINKQWLQIEGEGIVDLEEYLKKNEIATINGKSLIDGGNIEIIGESIYPEASIAAVDTGEIINDINEEETMKYYNFLGETQEGLNDFIKSSARVRNYELVEGEYKANILPTSERNETTFACGINEDIIYYLNRGWKSVFDLYDVTEDAVSSFEITKEEFEQRPKEVTLSTETPHGVLKEIYEKFVSAFNKTPNRTSPMLPIYVGYGAIYAKNDEGELVNLTDKEVQYIKGESWIDHNKFATNALILGSFAIFPEGTEYVITKVDNSPYYIEYETYNAEGAVEGKVFKDGTIKVRLNSDYSGNDKEGYALFIVEYPSLSENDNIKTSRAYTYDEETNIVTIEGVLQGTGAWNPLTERKDIQLKMSNGGRNTYMINNYVFSTSTPNAYVMGSETYATLNGK